MVVVDVLRCSRCRETKLVSEFSPGRLKPRATKWCRSCDNAYRRERYANDPTYRKRIVSESHGRYVKTPERFLEWQRRDRARFPLKYLVKDARQHAKGRVPFAITTEILAEKLAAQGGCCALTGLPFGDGPQRMSLDRIDSEQGYVPGNVQLVLWVVNQMKSSLSQDRFIALCQAVARAV